MICTAHQILFGLSFHANKAGGQVARMGEKRGVWCQKIWSKETDHSKTRRSMSQLGTLPSGSSTVKFTARMCTRLMMSAFHSYRREVWLPSVQISADLFQYINNTVLCGKARAMSCCCVAAVSANQKCPLGSAVKVTTFTWCSQPPGDGVQWQRHFVCSHMMWTVCRFLSCPLWEDGTFFWIQKQLSPTHWYLEISIFCVLKPSLGYCFPTLGRNAVPSVWGVEGNTRLQLRKYLYFALDCMKRQ